MSEAEASLTLPKRRKQRSFRPNFLGVQSLWVLSLIEERELPLSAVFKEVQMRIISGFLVPSVTVSNPTK